MKLRNILTLSVTSIATLLSSCGEKDHDHSGHGHGHDHDHGHHHGHDHSHGHGHDHDHSHCEVVLGENGGRMIQGLAELILTDQGVITLTFKVAPAEGTKVLVLLEGSPLALTQVGNVYQTDVISDQLPGEILVKITHADGSKVTEPPFKLEAPK